MAGDQGTDRSEASCLQLKVEFSFAGSPRPLKANLGNTWYGYGLILQKLLPWEEV